VLYLVIGGWATADGRFDLVPSALTLVAILFAVRKRWNWAFTFLALATVFKFYPLVLLIPFLLTEQMESGTKWASWRRWTPLAIFAAVCMGVMVISLFLSVEGTLAPFSYFANRPFQVESPGASLLWLFNFLGNPLQPVFAYGSFSVVSPLSSPVSLIDTVLLVAGLTYTWWLQWRGKTDLVVSCLLTLMIIIFTGKVFSPQYLLWILPLAAYVWERNPKWIAAWCLLGGLTTFIFPYLYTFYLGDFNEVSTAPFFYAVIAIRNLFFLCMIVSLLLSSSRKQLSKTSPELDMENTPVTMIEPPMVEEEETTNVHQSDEKPINVRRGEGRVEWMGGPLWQEVWGTSSPVAEDRLDDPQTDTQGDAGDHKGPLQPSEPPSPLQTLVDTSSVDDKEEQEETPIPQDSHQLLLFWHKLALGTVLVISAFFNLFALAKQDFFEYYYGAAIKSMLMNWHNFFFVSFDLRGFESLDKPPLGFWIQTLSAKLFGFSTFSVLLPEALAGVLAVALVFHLVRRVFGPVAGLIAALVLALSPISVVTSRNNIIDSLLTLAVLLAAWSVIKAVETGRLRWLCLCAVLVGLAFNIKFLQAYMVIPAFGLVYLLGSSLRWRTKLVYLAVALGVLLVVSLCWITIVNLTPAAQRPFVGSSPTNSELDLAFGYNGAFRLNADSTVVNGQAWEIGLPGIARFFEQPIAGQSSWLLPLALLGMLALGWQRGWRLPLNRRQQALVLWGTWLLTLLVFFSEAHFFHLYYLSMLAPAIAALVGAGVVTLWRDYVRRGWRGWLLPYALLIAGAFQAYFLAPFSQWSIILIVCILVLCAIVELALVLMRWRFPPDLQRVAVGITALGLLSLLLAPTVWSAIPLSREGRTFPMAGPPPPQALVPPNLADPVLIAYLLVHQGKAQYLLATMNTEAASPFIIDTGQAVMALGGYNGSPSFLTPNQLVQQIDSGAVRFFLFPSYPDQPVIAWVITHCRAVPTNQWQSPNSARYLVDELQLYDCARHT